MIAAAVLTLLAAGDPLAYQPAPVDNPLKGLVPYRRPADGRFPYAMEFDYLPLSALMTGPASFDWSTLDEMIGDIASRGRHTVFRIYMEYPGKLDAIPQFLIDDGLKTTRWTNTNTAPFPPKDCVTPDYSDPNLISAMETFIAALGERYDDDPRVAYVTAGMLGTWGEWHTYPRNDLWAPPETQTAVMNAFAKAFDNVPVLLRYPAAGDSTFARSTGRPFGYHDDSFCWATLTTGKPEDGWFFEPSLKRAELTDIWKTHPIGGEIRPELCGCVFDSPSCAPDGQSFAACRDRLHVTWLLDTGLSREQASEQRMANALREVTKLGYEFHVTRFATSAQPRGAVRVSVGVKNTGIAPFYRAGWKARFAVLKEGNREVVEHPSTRFDLTSVPISGEDVWETTFETSGLKAGRYHVLLGVPSTIPGGKAVRFANAGQDQHLPDWLTVGQIVVK